MSTPNAEILLTNIRMTAAVVHQTLTNAENPADMLEPAAKLLEEVEAYIAVPGANIEALSTVVLQDPDALAAYQMAETVIAEFAEEIAGVSAEFGADSDQVKAMKTMGRIAVTIGKAYLNERMTTFEAFLESNATK